MCNKRVFANWQADCFSNLLAMILPCFITLFRTLAGMLQLCFSNASDISSKCFRTFHACAKAVRFPSSHLNTLQRSRLKALQLAMASNKTGAASSVPVDGTLDLTWTRNALTSVGFCYCFHLLLALHDQHHCKMSLFHWLPSLGFSRHVFLRLLPPPSSFIPRMVWFGPPAGKWETPLWVLEPCCLFCVCFILIYHDLWGCILPCDLVSLSVRPLGVVPGSVLVAGGYRHRHNRARCERLPRQAA